MQYRLIVVAFLFFTALNVAPVAADVSDDVLTNPSRSEADRAVDDRRKPADVLRFFEIEPSDDVFDVFAGGGYYSELLSYLVGADGSGVVQQRAVGSFCSRCGYTTPRR